MNASEIVNILRKYRYIVENVIEKPDMIIIDFRHRSTRGNPYTTSSVVYYKDTGKIEATIRRKIDRHIELYLDYACEDGKIACRPHVYVLDGEPYIAVECKFHKNPIERLKRALEELM